MDFQIGLSALRASQFAIDNVSHNIANAGTEGYHRREVILENSQISIRNHDRSLQAGTGVDVSEVKRIRSLITENSLTNVTSDLEKTDLVLDIESRLETILERGEGTVKDALSSLFDDFTRLSANPGERTLRSSILNRANDLTARMRTQSNELSQLKFNLKQQLEVEVESLNRDIQALAEIQNEIRINNGSIHSNEQLDKRDQLINQIAERVDTQRFEFVQQELGISLAGSAVSIDSTPVAFETVYDDQGDVSIQLVGGDRPIDFVSGRIAGIVELHNDVVGGYQDQVDQFAGELIYQFDKVHSVGVGRAGAFASLQGTRPVSDVDLPLSQSAAFPVTEGELFISVTDSNGDVRTTSINVDPEADSLRDLATNISAVDNVQAIVDPATGNLSIYAASGHKFDFTGQLETNPSTANFFGTSVPQVGGDYFGEQNQTYTVTLIDGGEVGKTEPLSVRVTDGDGNLIQDLDIGLGYVAGEPIDIGSGLTVEFSPGSVNVGDEFEINLVANSDTSGVLPALGMNSLFQGTNASDIQLDRRIQNTPDAIATAASDNTADTQNIRSFIDLRNELVLGDGSFTFETFLEDVEAEIGFQVQTSNNLRESLSDLKFRFESERESISGVDVNEELIQLTEYQKGYEAAIQVIRTMESMLDDLFQILN
ncbi:MAG: flagellar hook-associated protein FlgK [Planctomycetota bacterium]